MKRRTFVQTIGWGATSLAQGVRGTMTNRYWFSGGNDGQWQVIAGKDCRRFSEFG